MKFSSSLKLRLKQIHPFSTIVNICIFAAFAAVELYFKNYLILISIVIFLAAILIFRRLPFGILTVLIMIMGLYLTSILGTVNALRNTIWQFQSSAIEYVNILFTPGAGKEVLSPQVREMLDFIEDYHLDDYRISDQLAGNVENYQRIVEAAWPIRYRPTSENLFIDISEKPDCQLIAVEDTIALTKCD